MVENKGFQKKDGVGYGGFYIHGKDEVPRSNRGEGSSNEAVFRDF